jgi:hypothetical protein
MTARTQETSALRGIHSSERASLNGETGCRGQCSTRRMLRSAAGSGDRDVANIQDLLINAD